jgi:cytochrome b pre-mRNA-processing protein 3
VFERTAHGRAIDRLPGEIMAAARRPGLYLRLGVPDSFEGRFEAFALLAILTIRRLGELEAPGPDLAQNLTDAIFRRFDIMFREMGVGDLTVPKRVRAMAEAFIGRSQAYMSARQDDMAMAAALARNVLGGNGDGTILLAYVKATTAMLETTPISVFRTGPLCFPEPVMVLS